MRERKALSVVDFLHENKIISAEVVAEIEAELEESGDDLGSILIRRGLVNHDTLNILLIEAFKNGLILLGDIYDNFTIDLDK
ncbi:MAG TPA: hypothetical protein ENK97_02870, partial [Campylobacteraceae bacterium]|nr:hypothetical protein [Campylobacteraceae bacterium]